MKRTNKRQELIKVGSKIIVQQGFNAASINTVLTTAGVPKGSFYYYFSSKENFGLAIIDDFASQCQIKLEKMLQNTQKSPLANMHDFFAAKIVDMQENQCCEGCLIGNLAQELSTQNELFRDRLNQIFDDWEKYFVKCLQAAYEAGEIERNDNLEDLAKFILSSWEGAILQSKVTKTVIPMQVFLKILFGQVLIRSHSR